MCRLLGVVASRPAALSELAGEDLGPFTKLACDHPDGWGIASVGPTGQLTIAKEPGPADRSVLFDQLTGTTVTDAAMLHIRLASPGFPNTRANTHPFGDIRVAFAHNGYFAPSGVLGAATGPGPAERLDTARRPTDSEQFYQAIRGHMADGMPPAKAIAETAATIRALAAECVSLNCLMLTPQALYAYAYHDPESEVMRRRGAGFFDLHYRIEPGRVMVASAGWPRPSDRWSLLPQCGTMEIRRADLTVIWHPQERAEAGPPVG